MRKIRFAIKSDFDTDGLLFLVSIAGFFLISASYKLHGFVIPFVVISIILLGVLVWWFGKLKVRPVTVSWTEGKSQKP
jgi:CHASE2 domain-containing sensor protein